MSFDDILVSVGEFGWYQKRVYFLLCLPAMLCGAQVLSAVFIMAIPDHRCKVPGYTNDTFETQSSFHADLINMSIPRATDTMYPSASRNEAYAECTVYTDVWEVVVRETDGEEHNWWSLMYGYGTDGRNGSVVTSTDGRRRNTRQCHEWVFDTSEFDSTAITEFNIVCDDKILRSICNSVMFGGALVGSIVMGIIADVHGRKRAIMLSLLVQFFTALGVCLTPNFGVMIALKSLSGVATHSLFAIGATMGIELVGPRKRTFTGMFVELFWAGGVLLILPIAFVSRDWRTTQLVLCVMTVPLFSLWWLIPESPRWLLSEGRQVEAEQILERICQSNNTKLPTGPLVGDVTEDAPKERFTSLFKHRVLLVRTLIVFYNWLAVNILYYGLSLNIENLSGSTYLNYLLGSSLEIVAYVLCLLLLDRTGRRRFHCFCMFVGGVACLATLMPISLGGGDYQWMVTSLALIGRMCVSGSYAIVYIMSAELFPTGMRNSAIGVCSTFENLGGMISPYIADLGMLLGGPFAAGFPMLVFGCVSVLAGALSLMLPETLHRALPETLLDAINFDRPRNSPPSEHEFKSPMLDCNSRTPLSSSQV